MSGARSMALVRTMTAFFGWRRLLVAGVPVLLVGLVLGPGWKPTPLSLLARATQLAFVGLVVFGVLERWPRRLPGWLARWVAQVTGVALAMPLGNFVLYLISTPPGSPPFWRTPDRLEGFAYLTFLSVLVAPWAALGGLVRQKEVYAQEQALAFALERSELERQALDARMRLLQAQVAPHFLFNTLANVQALVEAGSPRAPAVLRHLTTYLRAAVPRLGDQASTVGQEMELARAYLELMHMRMPDRLQFSVQVADRALSLRCPPMTVLTLIENAVRHGIDPSEDGGRVDVEVGRRGDRWSVCVSDTGVGWQASPQGRGTGLTTLRERLRLEFRGEVHLDVAAGTQRGARVRLELPAEEVGDR